MPPELLQFSGADQSGIRNHTRCALHSPSRTWHPCPALFLSPHLGPPDVPLLSFRSPRQSTDSPEHCRQGTVLANVSGTPSRAATTDSRYSLPSLVSQEADHASEHPDAPARYPQAP